MSKTPRQAHKSADVCAYVQEMKIFFLTLHFHDFFDEMCE